MAWSKQVITIRADFNHLDGRGRLILSDLRIHELPRWVTWPLSAARAHRPRRGHGRARPVVPGGPCFSQR